MGCGASAPTPSSASSHGSWGIGGPGLAYKVYGPKPRTLRSRTKIAELRQMLVYADEARKKLPEEEHRRLMFGPAFLTERHVHSLSAATGHQWALMVCSQLDTVLERELLQCDCFLALRDFARVVGMHLEWGESRWEQDQERDASHSICELRLRETSRFINSSFGPALIVVLGDKYGRQALPANIDAQQFETFLVELAKASRGEKLANCYVKDLNTVPPVYTLQRIDKYVPDFLNVDDQAKREKAEQTWEKDYLVPMLEDIKHAVQASLLCGALSQDEADTYLQPTGIQSAIQGVLLDAKMNPTKKATRSVFVNRNILQINPDDPMAMVYTDIQVQKTSYNPSIFEKRDPSKEFHRAQDAQAGIALERVRTALKSAIPAENVLNFSVQWEPEGINLDNQKHQLYISQVGDRITEMAAKILADQLTMCPKLSDIELEVSRHMLWLEERGKNLIGRSEALQKVRDFLDQKFDRENSLFSYLPPKRSGATMIITGSEGCGKTKLLCVALVQVARNHMEPNTSTSIGSMRSGDHGEPAPLIIFRAIGISHILRSGRDVMHSICLQLTSVVQSTTPVPSDYLELTVRFGMLLAEAGESRRVLIILDGLDQLDPVVDGTPCLHWLPVDSLPDNCFLVATVSSNNPPNKNGQVYIELKDRLSLESEWLHLASLRPEEMSSLLQLWLQQDKRDLTSLQKAVLLGTASAATDAATASVLQLNYCSSKTWKSFDAPPSISVSPNIPNVVHELFSMLESTFNKGLVANVLGAMSIAKAGLSRAEMLDFASKDDDLLKDFFKWCVPPYARVPPSAVSNLLHAVGSLVEEHILPGCSPVMQWKNSSFRWHCKERYDSSLLRKRMYTYFSGDLSQIQPLAMRSRELTYMLSTDRQVDTMPTTFWFADGKTKVNQRKMIELPPLAEYFKQWNEIVRFYCELAVFDALSSPQHVTAFAASWKVIEKHYRSLPEKAGGAQKFRDIIWEGFRGMVDKIEDYQVRSKICQRVAKFVRVELGMMELSLTFLESSLHSLVTQENAELDIADVLEEIANIHVKTGDHEAAIAKLDEVVAIRSKHFFPEHSKLTGPLKLLGSVMLSAGQIAEAMQQYNEVLRRLRGLDRSEYRLVVAEITTRIGDIHKSLGEFDRAIARHEEALRIRKAVLDPDHVDVAINVNALAILYEKKGDLNNALSRFAEALQIRRSKLGPCHVDVASIYNNMAVVYETLYQLPEATVKYEQALAVFRTKLGKNHIAIGTISNNLGNVCKNQGFFAKSCEYYEQALAIRRHAMPKSLMVADTLNNLAGVLLLRGEYDRSLECCEESIKIREELLGKEHIEVATMLNNIAGVRMKRGECDDTVEKLCMEALRIKSEQLGPDHGQVAEILNNVALLRNLQGHTEEALEITQQALDIQEETWGKSHVSTAYTMHCKALLFKNKGNLDEAVLACKEAIKVRKDVLGDDHLDVAISLQMLSEIRFQREGAHEKALENCAHALSIRRAKLGSEHIDVATSLHHAGKIYQALGRQDDTLQSFSEALAIRRKKLGNDHLDVASVLKDLALEHWNCDMFDDAMRELEEVVEMYRRTKNVSNMELANTLNSLAALYWNQSEYYRAEEVTIESLEIRKQVLGAEHVDVAGTLINLANVLESKGEPGKALLRCNEALDIYVAAKGSDTVEVAQLHAQMGVLHRAIQEDEKAQSHLQRSVEIFETVLGADHPDTQDARDILSTSTTPATTSRFNIDDISELGAENIIRPLDMGWAGSSRIEFESVSRTDAAQNSRPSSSRASARPSQSRASARLNELKFKSFQETIGGGDQTEIKILADTTS